MMTSLCARQRSVEEWAQIVRGEFDESPGLSLTRAQAKRLWGLDGDICDAVLQRLITSGFLRQNARQMFIRDDGPR
jgi:hypothetical protein